MANNLILSQIYDQYLTAYAPPGTSVADAHKKSELRGVYNSIVKVNKESPWVLQDRSLETRDFAVGVKEQARELKNTIYSVGGAGSDALEKKAAFSTDTDVVSVEYIGTDEESSDVSEYQVRINSLATSQMNLGSFLQDGENRLGAGTYSFDINFAEMSYEFQFGISEGETNKDVQNRLARLINNTNIGLMAEVIGDDNSRSALKITSAATGVPEGNDLYFTVNDTYSNKKNGATEYFGLNYTAITPKNASFTINGEEETTTSNYFTVDKIFALTLNGVSGRDEDDVTIGLKTDLESLADNISTLVNGYNTFVKNTETFSNALSRGRKLMSDIHKLSNYYRESLDSLGINTEDDGTLSINKDELLENISEDSIGTVKEFAGSLLRKTNQISINPMEYVDRTIVAYKNPGKSFASPYNTSQYSGMIFNGYC